MFQIHQKLPNEVELNLIKILRLDKKLLIFLLWVSFGLGFSMSIILSTIGLMEGFERDLLVALNKSNGDFSINLTMSESDLASLTLNLAKDYPSITSTGFYKSEVFLVGNNEQSKGAVLLAGNFQKNEMPMLKEIKNFNLKNGQAIVGEDLARELGLQLGDKFRALLSDGEGKGFAIKNFEIISFFKTNLYEKDSRVVLVNIGEFFLNEDVNFNYSIFNFNFPFDDFKTQKSRIDSLNEKLFSIDENLYALPYWDEHSTLIEAVEIEKISILVVLQVIVIVSVFNLLSFLIFFREKKIKELFTLHAMGFSPKKISRIWYFVSFSLWSGAIVVSTLLTSIFGAILSYISQTIMPKNIYHLGKINLYISIENYFAVYLISCCWILLMTFFLSRKFNGDSLLRGLRQQYV